MGLLRKQGSSTGDVQVEFLSGTAGGGDPPVFGPGRIIQGRVVVAGKRAVDIARVGIAFTGTTSVGGGGGGSEKLGETELFSIQDVLWDSKPSKGKEPAKPGSVGVDDYMTKKVPPATSGAGHVFLFAIKWPMVNFPPSLPAGRSVVHTEYALRAFIRTSSDEEITSDILPVEFRPHIDPSVASKRYHNTLESPHVEVKDDNGKVLGEASLSCTNQDGTIFGQDCQLKLELLIRQHESKNLPRKAKVEVSEIHRLHDSTVGKEQVFSLSHESITFPPDMLKCHQESVIPLRVHIPVPEVDTRRGATGLPTLRIGSLEVEYLVRVTVPLSNSRLLSTAKTKTITVECPVVVGNVKSKEKESTRKVPRLVVNSEGEGLWDAGSTGSGTKRSENRRNIVDWSETSDIPRVLPCGDVDEDDIV